MIVVEYRDRWHRHNEMHERCEFALSMLVHAATRYVADPCVYWARRAFEYAADALAATRPLHGKYPDAARMDAWKRLRVWALVVEREERREARRAKA